jgi:cytoskeletal protein RodZ
VTVNPGGGSGWDEPPLDIQIPDDARELDRDVLAYHRELRAQRRKNRLHRLTSPFAGRGTVMPLLASILAVCLVAGAMLSVATFSPAATAPADRSTLPSATAGAVSPSPPRSHATTATASASATATATASGPGSALTSTGAIPSTPSGAGPSSHATRASSYARSSAAPGQGSPSGAGAVRPSALSSSFASARPSALP